MKIKLLLKFILPGAHDAVFIFSGPYRIVFNQFRLYADGSFDARASNLGAGLADEFHGLFCPKPVEKFFRGFEILTPL